MGIIGKKRKASLEISPEGKNFVDDIVMTFIYMYKLRQDQERRARYVTVIDNIAKAVTDFFNSGGAIA
jgi:hypothetical protein